MGQLYGHACAMGSAGVVVAVDPIDERLANLSRFLCHRGVFKESAQPQLSGVLGDWTIPVL